MIRSEFGQRTAWIFVDIDAWEPDLGGYAAEAKRVVAEQVTLPACHTMVWSGQFQYLQEATRRLAIATFDLSRIASFGSHLLLSDGHGGSLGACSDTSGERSARRCW